MSVCASCGAENRPGARFCDSCGVALAAVEAPARAAEDRHRPLLRRARLDRPRRAPRPGDDASGDGAILRDRARGDRASRRHRREVHRRRGDGRLRRPAGARGRRAPRRARGRSSCATASRSTSAIGVNTGQVVTGRGDTLVTGDAVNVAARLEQAASPGEVLVGAETYAPRPRRSRGRAAAAARGEGEVRAADGVPAASRSRATRLTLRRLRRAARRSGARVRLLADAWERVRSERTCALFTILGTAGRRQVAPRPRVPRPRRRRRSCARRCLSYGEGITYWPVVEIVEAAARRPQAVDGPGHRRRCSRGHGASTDEIAFGVRRLLERAARRAAARRRARRRALGRAGLPRPRRARRRLEPRRADPADLPGAAGAPRPAAGLERRQAQRDHGAARAARSGRDRRADRRPARRRRAGRRR